MKKILAAITVTFLIFTKASTGYADGTITTTPTPPPNATTKIYSLTDLSSYTDGAIHDVGPTQLDRSSLWTFDAYAASDSVYNPQITNLPLNGQPGASGIDLNTQLLYRFSINLTAAYQTYELPPDFTPKCPQAPALEGVFYMVYSGSDATLEDCSASAGVLTEDEGHIYLSVGPGIHNVTISCLAQGHIDMLSEVIAGNGGPTTPACAYFETKINSVQFQVSPDFVPPPVLISVAAQHFEQVVQGPHLPKDPASTATYNPKTVDAVAGKSASYEVLLNLNPDDLYSRNGKFDIKITDSGTTSIKTISGIQLSEFDSNGNLTLSPTRVGSFVLSTKTPFIPKFEIVPEGTAPVTDVSYFYTPVVVHDVRVPKIGLAQINMPEIDLVYYKTTGGQKHIEPYTLPGANVNSTNYGETFSQSVLINSVYPIADSKFAFDASQAVVGGSLPDLSSYHSGVITDASEVGDVLCSVFAADLDKLEQNRELRGLDRIIGVVPQNYFSRRCYPQFVGFTPKKGISGVYLPISVVEDEYPYSNSVAHELGHSFQVGYDQYMSTPNGNVYGGPNSSYYGYDAKNQLSYHYGTSQPGVLAESIMGPFINGAPYWIDPTTYITIFQNLVSPRPLDPATLSVSGVLTPGGSFTFLDSQEIPNGVLTVADPSSTANDLTIQSLDSAGKLLASVTIEPAFYGDISVALGTPSPTLPIAPNPAPVVVQISNDPKASSLVAVQNNKVLAKVSASGQLLSGILSRVPVDAYKSGFFCHFKIQKLGDCSSGDQKILASLISDLQRAMNKPSNFIGRKVQLSILLDALVLTFKAVTYDHYQISSPADLTKEQVLRLLEQLRAKEC